MQPPAAKASSAPITVRTAEAEDVKFARPWLLRQVFSSGNAANRSNIRLGARLSKPLPVASLFSTVLPRFVPRIAIPARPLPLITLLRMILPVASTDGALMRMPQWLPRIWLSTI